MEVVHGGSAASSKNVHAVGMYHGNMRVPWRWIDPLGNKRGPRPGLKVEDVSIGKMAVPIMSTIQKHVVLVHDRRRSIPSPRSTTRSGNQMPLTRREIEFVQV